MNSIQDYIIQSKTIETLTLREALDKINAVPGKKLGDAKLRDFLLPLNILQHARGIYIFKHKDDFLYIGKNSSRSFLERVSSHVDIIKENPFQRLLRHFYKIHGGTNRLPESTDEIRSVLERVFDEVYIILIAFPEGTSAEFISNIERNLLFGGTNAANKHKKREWYLDKSVISIN